MSEIVQVVAYFWPVIAVIITSAILLVWQEYDQRKAEKKVQRD